MKAFVSKSAVILLLLSWLFLSCQKDEKESERFRNLTQTTWKSDSLMVNGQEASGPGDLLEDFLGTAVFQKDGTGTFGAYQGTWRFAQNETQLVIQSDALPVSSLSTQIEELTAQSLKLTTSFINFDDLQNPLQIRLTFKPS